jgi:D-glycero-alpha-D-manno-heptose-7-phosphate kinase
MIISRTPLRISFAGGGSDLQAYYRHGYGAVTSTAINKYIYITVNRKFDDRIRLSYSKTEIVDSVDDIQHDIVREAMKLTGVDRGVEITSVADIPSRGTGLGSSSSFTAGLLNALYAFDGKFTSAERLASEACRIEIEILGEPIGKQDQYAGAYGGMNHIQFNSDGTVFVDPVICSMRTKELLNERLMLFYTGLTRRASSILTEQKKKTDRKLETLGEMVRLSEELRDALRANDLDEFGETLHRGWTLKKELAGGISNPEIDGFYEKARRAGAIGGKVLGAGGGGFLLFYCEEGKQAAVREALSALKETQFKLEPQGSKIIYVEE